MKRIFTILCLSLFATVTYAQKAYHDAAMFDISNGKVKYIEYTADKSRITFSEDGRIIKKESPYLSIYSKYEIKRDKDGYPVTLTTEFDKTKFEYDSSKRISKRTVISGGQTVVFSYNYEKLPNVTITRIESEAGQPKKTDEVFDMNEFDAFGNWIQKGKKGTLKTEQKVSTDIYFFDTAHHGQTTSVEYVDKYDGQTKENRIIAYASDKSYKRSDSPNEVKLEEAIKDFFFFNVGDRFKDVAKHIKKNKVEHTMKKGYYGRREIIIPNSDKLFYGNPITSMCYNYFKGSLSENGDYSFVIELADPSDSEDFLKFLAGEMGVNIFKGKENALRISLLSNDKMNILTTKDQGLLVIWER